MNFFLSLITAAICVVLCSCAEPLPLSVWASAGARPSLSFAATGRHQRSTARPGPLLRTHTPPPCGRSSPTRGSTAVSAQPPPSPAIKRTNAGLGFPSSSSGLLAPPPPPQFASRDRELVGLRPREKREVRLSIHPSDAP